MVGASTRLEAKGLGGLDLLSKCAVESFCDILWAMYSAVFVWHGKIAQNRAAAPSNDREFNLLWNRAVEGFWDALWLCFRSFLSVIVVTHSIVQGHLLVVEN